MKIVKLAELNMNIATVLNKQRYQRKYKVLEEVYVTKFINMQKL